MDEETENSSTHGSQYVGLSTTLWFRVVMHCVGWRWIGTPEGVKDNGKQGSTFYYVMNMQIKEYVWWSWEEVMGTHGDHMYIWEWFPQLIPLLSSELFCGFHFVGYRLIAG